MRLRTLVQDPLIVLLALILTGVGILFSFDAGYARSLQEGRGPIPLEFKSQLLQAFIAVGAAALFSWLGTTKLRKLARPFWVVSLIGLVLALVGPLKQAQNGAERWVKIGIAVQPAEFAKLAVILYMAAIFADRKLWPKNLKLPKDPMKRLDTLFIPKLIRILPAIWVLIAIVLIDKEPDLGTAAVIAVTTLAIAFLGGASKKSLFIGLAIGVLGVGVMLKAQPYRLERLENHAQRWSADHIDDTGYQTVQSEVSMAGGGFFGVGIGNGRAKHVLPAATTDFVMATVAEEFGLFGTLVVLGLLGTLTARLLMLAKASKNRFTMLTLSGIAIWIGIQGSVNLLQANGTVPPIGIPFPFVSTGGSSLIALWAAIGTSQAVLQPIEDKALVGGTVENRSNGRRNRRSHLSRA